MMLIRDGWRERLPGTFVCLGRLVAWLPDTGNLAGLADKARADATFRCMVSV